MLTNREVRRIELAMMVLHQVMVPGHKPDALSGLSVRLAACVLLGTVDKATLAEFVAVYRNDGLRYGSGSLPPIDREAALTQLINGIDRQVRARLAAGRPPTARPAERREYHG